MRTINLPAVPVRYSGSVPSMSRRGGIRLHPVSDGTANMLASSQYIRTRDIGGNKLRDIVDPQTGFVARVTSPMESKPANTTKMSRDQMEFAGVAGGATGNLRYLASTVRLDSAGHKVYLDEAGRRIRTTAMGETAGAAVPRAAHPDRPAKTRKRGANVAARPVKSSKPNIPGGSGPAGRITDDDIKNYINALAARSGYPAPTVYTATMMRDGREALKLARKRAELALAKLGKES